MARSEAPPRQDRLLPAGLVQSRPELIPPDYSDAHTLLVTFGFRCNLACVFCMVEDVLGVYRGADLETFRRFVGDAEAMKRIRRVTFSGGEATLERELLEYVELARATPGVEHVRVQTNGTRLANRKYLRALLDAGVDEFFVSVHGPDEAICDALTARKGSFRAIVAGLEAIAGSGATLMTNTAIVAQNHQRLADIVALVAPFGPRTMDFWNLWPRIDQGDTRGLFVRVGQALPHLVEALEACERRGILPIVKWFPHCLLGRFQRYHDDSQPTVLVEQSYWEQAPKFACLYEGVCAHVPQPCAGLSHPYIKKFGWEEDVLRPARGAAEAAGAGAAPATPVVVARPGEGGVGLTVGQALGGWRVRGLKAYRNGHVVVLADGAGELRVRLYPTDPRRPCMTRSARWDIVPEQTPDAVSYRLEPLLLALVEALDR